MAETEPLLGNRPLAVTDAEDERVDEEVEAALAGVLDPNASAFAPLLPNGKRLGDEDIEGEAMGSTSDNVGSRSRGEVLLILSGLWIGKSKRWSTAQLTLTFCFFRYIHGRPW